MGSDTTIKTVDWADIERGDTVYDRDEGEPIGIVGHRDTRRVDVEPYSGGTVTLEHEEFGHFKRYRAMRLVEE